MRWEFFKTILMAARASVFRWLWNAVWYWEKYRRKGQPRPVDSVLTRIDVVIHYSRLAWLLFIKLILKYPHSGHVWGMTHSLLSSRQDISPELFIKTQARQGRRPQARLDFIHSMFDWVLFCQSESWRVSTLQCPRNCAESCWLWLSMICKDPDWLTDCSWTVAVVSVVLRCRHTQSVSSLSTAPPLGERDRLSPADWARVGPGLPSTREQLESSPSPTPLYQSTALLHSPGRYSVLTPGFYSDLLHYLWQQHFTPHIFHHSHPHTPAYHYRLSQYWIVTHYPPHSLKQYVRSSVVK